MTELALSLAKVAAVPAAWVVVTEILWYRLFSRSGTTTLWRSAVAVAAARLAVNVGVVWYCWHHLNGNCAWPWIAFAGHAAALTLHAWGGWVFRSPDRAWTPRVYLQLEWNHKLPMEARWYLRAHGIAGMIIVAVSGHYAASRAFSARRDELLAFMEPLGLTLLLGVPVYGVLYLIRERWALYASPPFDPPAVWTKTPPPPATRPGFEPPDRAKEELYGDD